MRISNNLGSFNRFVTLLFHDDWLFLFLFFFHRMLASIESIDESTRWPKKFQEHSSYEMKAENSWLVAKVIVCKWKSVTLKFCIPRNERKKKNFYQRHAKLFHPILDKTYVPLKCTKKFSLSRSFFLCYSLVSPYILSLSTSRTHQCLIFDI